MTDFIKELKLKISDYRRKYYLNQLIKGTLIGLSLIVGTFLVVNFLEFFGRFNSLVRLFLLLTLIGFSSYTLFQYILKPIFYLYNIKKPFGDEEAAQHIGDYFPTIKDKLLNTLQLSRSGMEENSLLYASIQQKTEELKYIKFVDAINLGENKKYLKYAIPPLALALLIAMVTPRFFASTNRIVKFNQTFAEPAPFEFVMNTKNLQAIKDEDFRIDISLKGNSLPTEVYLNHKGRKYKLTPGESNQYSYTFQKIQGHSNFYFTAGGFNSSEFKINVISRPALTSFNVNLKYPAYLNKASESFDNVGNLVVPEGTEIKWLFKTQNTEEINMNFNGGEPIQIEKGILTDYNYQNKFIRNTHYSIQLKNKFSTNADSINYLINVIPDEYPSLNFEQLSDSSLYNYIGIGGSISDDYGLTRFRFAYRTAGEKTFNFQDIPFNKNSLSQTFFYQVDINDLGLNKGSQLEYYLIVTDNDGVNGGKSTQSSIYRYNMPSDLEFDQAVDQEISKTEDHFEELHRKSEEFKRDLENLENTLKRKRELDFQDQKELERLIQEKDDLNKELNKLRDQLQNLLEKQNRFEPQSPETREKMQMLQEMIEEMLQNDDSELFEELKNMLEKQIDENSLSELEKFKQKQRNIDKDLDRTLNLFKELQRKQKIEEVAKNLERLAEEQKELAEKTQSESESNEQLIQEQEEINEKFDNIKDKIEDIEKLSEESNKGFDKQEEDQKDISDELKESSKNLQENKKDDASNSQDNASKKIKKMADDMKSQMQSMEMVQLQQDYQSLRSILENLINVSHNQEDIMINFRNINVSDPRFVPLSQRQLDISNDTKIIEDSLYALAGRVMQLEAVITKEVTFMKNTIDESLTLIRERKLPQAAAKQQYSMTSMNNLALMLSDVFNQMQQNMMPSSGEGEGDGGMDDIGERQKELNQRIEGIGQGEKTPREISEEIADIIEEQSKIREELKRLEDLLNGTEAGEKLGEELKQIQEEMDKSETDLANKRVGRILKRRQQNIETRLLEAEKAIKEQELDPTRQGRTAPIVPRKSPPELEEFKREKEKQVELIRTTPPNFTPFYKNQTDNYFKRIK